MDSQKKKTLADDEISSAPVGRRSAMGMIGGAAIGLAATGCFRGIRSGCTDADPMDGAGRGRRCGGGGGCTDSDPRDAAGRGVRCGGRGGVVVVGGCSDSDPRDPVGRGARCGRRQCTDSDPQDPAGAGRRC